MADSNNSHDEGYARELAIAQRLEGYLANCVGRLDPPAVIRCVFDSQAAAVGIRCDVEVDQEAMTNAAASLKKELRPLSEAHDAAAATIEWEAVIPAIVKIEHDHSNQVCRVVLRAIEFPVPPAEHVILQLPTAHPSNPNFGLPADNVKHVIVLIHGIKDIGAWQKKVSKHLVEKGTVVEQIRYGLYPAIRFLFPVDLSGGPVKKVLKRIRALKNQYRNANFSIIAHSFGTYVILKAMQADTDLEFWKIIFCGSVADDQFEWSDLKRRVGDGDRAVRDFILNDCGTGDVWPLVGAAFGWHYGMAGVTGFSEGFVTNRFHRATSGTKGGHGLYFDPEFVKAHWRPFLIDDVAPRDGNGEQGEHLPFFIKWLYHGWLRALCKVFVLLVWLGMGAIAVGGAYYIVAKLISESTSRPESSLPSSSESVGSYTFSKKLLVRSSAVEDKVLKSLLIAEAVLLSNERFSEGEEALAESLRALTYQKTPEYSAEFETTVGSQAAFSQDGTTLAVAGGADLWVYDLSTHTTSRFAAQNLSSIRSIAVSHSGQYVAGVTHGTSESPGVVYLWKCRANGVLHGEMPMEVDKVEYIDSDLVNQTIAFDSKDFLYAITDEDRVLKVFPADTGLQRTTLQSDGMLLSLSPNGAYVAVKEAHEGQKLLSIKMTGVGVGNAASVWAIPLMDYSSQVQFSVNGDFVVLRRPLKSPSIQVWDISRRQVYAEVDATTLHFKQMHLTSDGRELAVLDSDGNATCYKLPGGDPYEKLTEVHDICFSADGRYRALVRWGGKVIVETVLRLPPRKLTRDLTAEEWEFYIGSAVPYRMTREALLNRN